MSKQSFSYERPDGVQRTLSGYLKSTKRWFESIFDETEVEIETLPPRVDLRKKMTPVEDQSDTNSCVANAVAGAYEYLVKQHHGDDAYDVSRLFIYYNARAIAEELDPLDEPEVEDEGTIIGAAIEGLRRFGACAEETWPFEVDDVDTPPDQESYDEAAEFLVEEVEQVPLRLEAWKAALASGHPIIFGLSLFESFDAHRRPGMVPAPSKMEASRESHGGHAMLAVGYSDRDQVFIVRNSWGDEWGDEGYCYIPYSYLINKRFNDGDSWIIKRVDVPEIDESVWDDDDESLIDEVDSEIANMSDEAYGELRDAMGAVPFETRLAIIFFVAAAADDEVEDSEIEAITEVLGGVLEAIGSKLSAEKVLERAIARFRKAPSILEDSITKFAEHVPTRVLAAVINAVQQIIEVDTEDEENLLAALIEAWQVDALGQNDGIEEDDDEDDDDDDEDEDEDD